MRHHPIVKVERCRVRRGLLASDASFGINGSFLIPCGKETLRVIASDGSDCPDAGLAAWEHVSVSLPSRCPTWEEMDFIKNLFWREDEAVMQLHPPRKDWINCHPYCLHLWKPCSGEIPLPPSCMVGYNLEARG